LFIEIIKSSLKSCCSAFGATCYAFSISIELGIGSIELCSAGQCFESDDVENVIVVHHRLHRHDETFNGFALAQIMLSTKDSVADISHVLAFSRKKTFLKQKLQVLYLW
jgi:hypothetical protein